MEFGDWIDGKGRTLDKLNSLKRISAGTVLQIKGAQYLVGDVNELMGTCDDCREFTGNEIVQRYRQIKWEDQDTF